MSPLLFILVLAVAVIACYLRQPASRRPEAPVDWADFRAVTVTFDQDEACPAVREFAQRRFLCSEAPALPLPDCTEATCICRFERHADRRQGSRRAAETGVFEPLFDGVENRVRSGGRRAEDAVELDSITEPSDFDPSATYSDFIAQTDMRPEGGKQRR